MCLGGTPQSLFGKKSDERIRKDPSAVNCVFHERQDNASPVRGNFLVGVQLLHLQRWESPAKDKPLLSLEKLQTSHS